MHPLRPYLAPCLALACLGCEPGAAPTPEPTPTSWSDEMASGAGHPVAPEELEAIAEELRTSVQGRLEKVAQRIEPGADWRRLFSDLQEQHPPDAEAVVARYREEIERARSFVAERGLVPLPGRQPEVLEARNPALRSAFSLALYLDGRLGVVAASADGDEVALRNHCRVCIPPLVVHETYPGHHVAFALTGQRRFTGDPREPFFHEGWGQYSELLMLEAGYFAEPADQLAVWRNLLLRVTRAQVDARLHRGALTEGEAIAIYRDELGLPEPTARAELVGHRTHPGHKASYLVGLLQILALRERATAADPSLTPAELHRRLLTRVGSWPEIAREQFGCEIGRLRAVELPAAPDQAGS